MRTAVAILSTIVPLLACSESFSPPPGLPSSEISYSCSFTGVGDYTALMLRGKPAVPYVYVMFLARTPQQVQSGTWVAASDSVSVFYYTALDQFEVGSGTITITHALEHIRHVGELNLQFGSQHISGAFQARWNEPWPVC